MPTYLTEARTRKATRLANALEQWARDHGHLELPEDWPVIVTLARQVPKATWDALAELQGARVPSSDTIGIALSLLESRATVALESEAQTFERL